MIFVSKGLELELLELLACTLTTRPPPLPCLSSFTYHYHAKINLVVVFH